jgi:PKD repeat protein/photosystem II stability/assembly factor-like uncharacterized protein
MQKSFLRLLVSTMLLLFAISNAQAQTNDTATYPYWVEMMQNPEVNFFDVQRAFNTYWEGREITKGSGFKPYKRWEYMMAQRVAPDGTRPPADRDMQAFIDYFGTDGNQRDMLGEWAPLGPFTVPSGYNGYRGLGRLNAIAFHPNDPETIFLGAPSGGLWISTDHGQNWETHTDHLPTLGVSAIIVDAEDPDIIFIGTGDRDAADAPGLGVWKSFDGGINWEPSNNGMGNVTVGRMIAHPDDNAIILAASSGGIFRTENAGLSWEQSLVGNFKDIEFKPNDPDIVYATRGGNFFRSEDNGVTFTQITNGLPGGNRGAISVSPANPEMVYFVLTNADSYKGMYRSTDAGLSFSERSTTPNIMSWGCNGGSGGQAWYDLDMAVDPTNADVVYVGGVNIFKSVDGGINWFIVAHWWGDCQVTAVHADLHVFEYSPHNNWLYAGNDGGIYWTANAGTTWTEISNGLVISQAYKIGQSQTMRDFVINGYQDNGTSVMNGTAWISVGGGDGMECAYDPTNHLYAYSSLYYGSINRVYNNSSQGQIAGNNVNGINESGGWVTPFLVDHQDPNTMFIGYKNVWRSNNIKAASTSSVSWTKISDWGNNDLEQLRQSWANANVLYASRQDKLYRTTTAKGLLVNWTNISGLLPTNNTITAIETNPFDEDVVYIAQQDRLFKSSNKGQEWDEITGSLPSVNINSIACYRNSNEGLYLGTDIGIFYKDAEMDDWMAYGNGFPASGKVTEIEIFYETENPAGDVLRAGTYGRGLWESPPYYGYAEANFSASTPNTSAGCAIHFNDLSTGVPHSWQWTFEGATPSTSSQQHPQGIVYDTEGSYTVSLTVSNPNGSSTLTLDDYVIVGPASAPEAIIAASDSVGCPGLVVQFSDASINCPDSWEWSFEPDDVVFMNGSSPTSQNPQVRFDANTHYSVSLTVTNDNGTNTTTLPNYIKIGGYELPYLAGFNHSTLEDAGWTVINPGGAVTWSLITLGDGRRVPWMNFRGYPSFGNRDMMISPPINLSDYENAYLSFEHAYAQFYYQKDSLIVSISDDCGQTWQRIFANGPDGQGIFETAEPTPDPFEPQSPADWCMEGYGARCTTIDLQQWLGKANIKFRFESFTQYGNNLYLDNIAVSQTTALPAMAAENSLPIIFPNPVQKQLVLHLPKGVAKAEFMLRDLKGVLLIRQNISHSQTSIATDRLSPGVFAVELRHESGSYSQKIVVQ